MKKFVIPKAVVGNWKPRKQVNVTLSLPLYRNLARLAKAKGHRASKVAAMMVEHCIKETRG